MNTTYSDRNIESWVYSSWGEIVGNRRLKAFLQAMARSIVGPDKGQGINTLVLGPSRSGKTSTVEFFVKTVLCWNLDHEKFQPCGKCHPCVQCAGRYELLDMDQILHGGLDHDVCFVPIDGNKFTQADIDQAIDRANGRCGWRWIYYIDEIQGLVRRHLDHSLFKAVEQHKHVTWIVSTATTKGLDPMFRNRFTEVATELPSIGELAPFLGRRCRTPGINITWDEDTTLIRLAERSKQLTGLALKCLAQAKMFGGQLTCEMVEQYAFEQVEM